MSQHWIFKCKQRRLSAFSKKTFLFWCFERIDGRTVDPFNTPILFVSYEFVCGASFFLSDYFWEHTAICLNVAVYVAAPPPRSTGRKADYSDQKWLANTDISNFEYQWLSSHTQRPQKVPSCAWLNWICVCALQCMCVSWRMASSRCFCAWWRGPTPTRSASYWGSNRPEKWW